MDVQKIAAALTSFGVPVQRVQRASTKRLGGVLLTSRVACYVPTGRQNAPCIVRLRNATTGEVIAWPPRIDMRELYEDYVRAVSFGAGLMEDHHAR